MQTANWQKQKPPAPPAATMMVAIANMPLPGEAMESGRGVKN
mgnify:CR=1 FL=1